MEQYGAWANNHVAQMKPEAKGDWVRFTDAQATIAALQARVKELEESRDAWKASQECSEKAYMALVNQIPAERFDYDPINVALLDGAKEQEVIGRRQIADLQAQLTQRTAERDTARRRVDELEAREVDVVLLREDLEQRTAEMEAAQQERDRSDREADQTLAKWSDVSTQLDVAHAELERVRGQYAYLSKLVAALPKVEGEIEVSSGVYNFILLKHDSGTRFLCGQIETEQTAQAIAALWEHRQGMEG